MREGFWNWSPEGSQLVDPTGLFDGPAGMTLFPAGDRTRLERDFLRAVALTRRLVREGAAAAVSAALDATGAPYM